MTNGRAPPTGFDFKLRDNPSRYGVLGLLKLDEYAVDALVSAIQCQGAGNVPVARQRERLRHALAAFMIRCQVGGEWEGE